MGYIPSGKDDGFLACVENTHLVYVIKTGSREPATRPILKQVSAVHILAHYFFKSPV
jgi:hypothetical protein